MDQRKNVAIHGIEKRLPLHLGMVAIEKGAFRSSSTKVANYKLKQIYVTHRRDPNKYHSDSEWILK